MTTPSLAHEGPGVNRADGPPVATPAAVSLILTRQPDGTWTAAYDVPDSAAEAELRAELAELFAGHGSPCPRCSARARRVVRFPAWNAHQTAQEGGAA